MKNQTLGRQFTIWTVLLVLIPSLLVMTIYTIGQMSIAKEKNLELISQRVNSVEEEIRQLDIELEDKADCKYASRYAKTGS